ncbi:two-component sensor histidine kinase [Spirosoma sp. KCTC 42546]|uniref:sensor histidine kinase n=1 Tax=Spirosoma sp. KCTC 42546 TaxID=2520506 RepID=UPI0011571D2E|nr:ATP-binding protein [Spirosoma sp. KCTC 42546]QDK79974.1 two-component sensor histidine kinase [Spirosoma sp. KCTC 42546]
MKRFFRCRPVLQFILFFTLAAISLQAQVIQVDSIVTSEWQRSKSDIGRLKAALSQNMTSSPVADSLLIVARQLAYPPGQVIALCQLAGIRLQQQQTQQAAGLLQEASQLAEQTRDLKESVWMMNQVSRIQRMSSRTSPSFSASFVPVLESLGRAMSVSASMLGRGKGARAFPFEPPTSTSKQMPDRRAFQANPSDFVVQVPNSAFEPLQNRHFRFKTDIVDRLLDTLIHFDKSSPQVVVQLTEQKKRRDSSHELSKAFAKEGDYAKAYQYFLQYSAYKDSLTAETTTRRLASLAYKQNLLKKEAQIKLLTKDRQLREQESNRQRQFVLVLVGCIALLAAFSIILTRNNRAKHLANQQLHEQKEALQQTLVELKTTQDQLIQSEKMASLGELTAGIAHEIQNPLNFVNNFSEVSSELVDELKEGPFQNLPETDKEYADEILGDLTLNLQKITHHGSRASAIVKGMLEHSRTSTGERQPTDLNALCDEYLRLAYHGLRAKDKTFNAELKTDFDPKLGKLTVVQQDLGRVLLNLFNNAFYAVSERKKQQPDNYHPTVKISTKRTANQVTIRISDNGTGIPQAVKDKIFQPFFTTKPSGAGTGLGLSLSYDIITKGHNGSLLVQSQEGEGTAFTIELPIS